MSEHIPVAVVDDEGQFSAFITAYLSARGYRARSYGGGEEFLASVAKGDIPTVVLLDVSMPGLGGLQTLQALLERHPECQVVMMSGHGDAPTIVEALRLGALDYVVKGQDADASVDERLDAILRRAFERADIVARAAEFRRDGPARSDVHWPTVGRMRNVNELIDRVADCDVTVLIRGESGSGKEVVARAIHDRSPRAHGPFVKINCAALPAELLESELFGHERGAFTGADLRRVGKFEHAAGGTILLDEIGEMSPGLQAKLLHVLQDATFTRLGSNQLIPVRARVLAATHRDLAKMIADGAFREDLFYRLSVIEITVPPLRERRDELPGMIAHFLAEYSARLERPVPEFTDDLRLLFESYDWPGNVRELENTLKRLVLLQDPWSAEADLRFSIGRAALRRESLQHSAPGTPEHEVVLAPAGGGEGGASRQASEYVATADATPSSVPHEPVPAEEPGSLPEVAKRAVQQAERTLISMTLTRTRWNRKEAAERLGVSYKTLLTKIRELGLDASE